MSSNYAFSAEKRERAGKGVARALRREGKIPAVIYGDKKEPIKISLPANAANVEYYKGRMFTTLCDLNVDGDKHVVLARDVQLHPVTDIVEHIDFLRVNKNTKIAVNVPVQLINEDQSPGLGQRGVLTFVRHEVELVCSAMDIPEILEVDAAGKVIGDSIRISDAKLPAGSAPVISDRDFIIANISAPIALDDEPAAEGEGADAAAPAAAAEGAEAAESAGE